MWTPWNNTTGAARWVAILATALIVQLGLCQVSPYVVGFIARHSSGEDVDNPWLLLPMWQLALFLLTILALMIAIIIRFSQSRRSRRLQ